VGKKISGTNHWLWIWPIVRTRVKVLTDSWNWIECGIGISKNSNWTGIEYSGFRYFIHSIILSVTGVCPL
jgi:hypothetical protein